MSLTMERPRAELEAEHAAAHHGRRWWVLAVLSVAQLMVVLDATIVNIALPSAQQSLGFSDNSRQWVVTAYALSFGALLLLGGRLGDLFGRKRVFIFGSIGFAVASTLGGASQSGEMLIFARALQGVMGAVLAPAALSLLTTTFGDGKERAKAFAIYGAIAGTGGAIGLLLGGALTEFLSWRWCMYVNDLIAVVAVLGALAIIPNPLPAERPRLDFPGTFTVSAGLFALVYGFSHAETGGWADAITIGFLVAGVVLLAAFVVIERRAEHALLPMRVVLDRNRGASYLSMFITGAGMFGVFLFLTYYMAQNLHFSALRTGFAFLPMIGSLMVSATALATPLQTRVSPKWLVSGGMVLATIGMVLLTALDINSNYTSGVLPALIVIGFGLGLVFGPGMNNATAGVEADDAGVASATVNAVQQVGGSIGTAFLNTMAATAAASYATSHTAPEAVIHSYTVVFWITAGIYAAGAVVAALLFRREVPEVSEHQAMVH